MYKNFQIWEKHWLRKWLSKLQIVRTVAEPETPILWPPDVTHWKRPWCWERLRTKRERGKREQNGWMTSPTQRTRVWANSRRQRRKGKPRMLQSLGSQIVGRDLATEQRKQCQRTLPRHITVTLLNVSKKKILKKSTEKEKLCTREKG